MAAGCSALHAHRLVWRAGIATPPLRVDALRGCVGLGAPGCKQLGFAPGPRGLTSWLASRDRHSVHHRGDVRGARLPGAGRWPLPRPAVAFARPVSRSGWPSRTGLVDAAGAFVPVIIDPSWPSPWLVDAVAALDLPRIASRGGFSGSAGSPATLPSEDGLALGEPAPSRLPGPEGRGIRGRGSLQPASAPEGAGSTGKLRAAGGPATAVAVSGPTRGPAGLFPAHPAAPLRLGRGLVGGCLQCGAWCAASRARSRPGLLWRNLRARPPSPFQPEGWSAMVLPAARGLWGATAGRYSARLLASCDLVSRDPASRSGPWGAGSTSCEVGEEQCRTPLMGSSKISPPSTSIVRVHSGHAAVPARAGHRRPPKSLAGVRSRPAPASTSSR